MPKKTKKPEPDLSYPAYRFEERCDPDDEWRGIPVDWLAQCSPAGTEEIHSAISSLEGARALVANCNAEIGWTSYQVVVT